MGGGPHPAENVLLDRQTLWGFPLHLQQKPDSTKAKSKTWVPNRDNLPNRLGFLQSLLFASVLASCGVHVGSLSLKSCHSPNSKNPSGRWSSLDRLYNHDGWPQSHSAITHKELCLCSPIFLSYVYICCSITKVVHRKFSKCKIHTE